MRIPSGDLAPARKRRRGYGSRRRSRYGHQRSPLVPVLAVLLVLAVAGVAWALRQNDSQAGRSTVAQLQPCPSPTAAAPAKAPAVAAPLTLPAPGQVQLRLLNGSGRSLLARTVGNELAARGFRVSGMGNAPKPLTGDSRVYFGPGARPAATLLAAHVMNAQLVPVASAAPGSIDVVLGSTFPRLRTPAEVSVAARTLAAGAPPKTVTATKAPAPKPSPTCR